MKAEADPSTWRTLQICGLVAVVLPLAAAGLILVRAMPGTIPAAVIAAVLAGAGLSVAIVVWAMERGRERRSLPGAGALSVIDTLPFACAVVDRSGRAEWANERFEQLFPDDLHAPFPAIAARAHDNAARVSLMADRAAAGEHDMAEVAAQTAAGDAHWVVSTHPIGDGGAMTVLIVRDVTAERSTARQRACELEHLGAFLEDAPLGFYAVGAGGNLRAINATLATWLGCPKDALLGGDTRLHEIIEAESGAPPHAPFASQSDDMQGESHVLAKGGKVPARIVHFASGATTQGDGGVALAGGIVRTPGLERQHAAAMDSLRAEIACLFDATPVAIVRLDEAGFPSRSNAAWRSLAGDAGAGQRRFVEAFAAEDAQEVETRIALARQDGGAPPPLEAELVRMAAAKPETRRVRIHFAPAHAVAAPPGKHAGILAFIVDLGRRDELDDRVIQGQKMQAVGQLAGGIAHDFNNLLTAMLGFCDLLLLRHSPGDPSFADIMQIKQNASRAANLVRQLLAFSRQQTLKPTVISVTDVLAELTSLLRRLLGANIALDVVHERDLGLIRVDLHQLEQVVINLAVNARDAMPGGGSLSIRTRNLTIEEAEERAGEIVPKGNYVVIDVADTGTGIPDDVVGHIFEPFFTTKEVGAGTGLGLSTVYGIVRQTGGFIFVDTAAGRGTTFEILLPRHRADQPPQAEARDAREPAGALDLTGAGTVLFVEDEDAVRLFGASALRAKGYTVIEARTGEAALDVLTKESIDVLVTDIIMPEMDGADLIRQVRLTRPDQRIICISGYAEDSFRRRLAESDDIRFLPKPFTLNQLAGAVKTVLAADRA